MNYSEKILELEKKIEDLTRENSLYADIINRFPYGIHIFDNKGYSYKINEKQKELLGIPNLEEGIGNYNVLSDPISIYTGANENFKQAYAGNLFCHQFEYSLANIDCNSKKEKITFKEFIFPITNRKEEVEYVVSVLNDISTEVEIEKRLSEQKIRESYSMLQNLTAQVPGVVYQYRLNADGSSSFPYSSEGMYEIYEVTSDEVRTDASPVFTRIHPEDFNYIVETIQESARNLSVYHSEFRVILPKQGLRWRHCDARPQRMDDGGTLWYGIITDITERKLAEAIIFEKNEEINTFFSCALDLLCIADTSGHFLRLNREWENILGYKLSDLEKMNFMELIHPDDLAATNEILMRLEEQKEIFDFTNRYRCKNGDYKWIEWKSYPVGGKIYAAARDITQQKLYIKEIEKKNSFIQKVLDNLPIGIALNNFDDGDATYMNQKFEEIYGWSKKDITSISNFFKNVYPDKEYREQIQKKIIEDIESGNPDCMHWENIQITQKNGNKRTVNAVNIPLIDQNTMVSTVWDITELSQYEKQLIEAKEKAEESDRLKSAFLQNMSHEIRTPMNGIMGFSEMLQKKNITEEKRKFYSDIIIKSTKQLLSIVTDIITISSIETKQEKLNISKVNINDIVNNLFNLFEPETKAKSVQLSVNNALEHSLAFINTDESKLTQILSNLISNAIKFTHQGTIKIGYTCIDTFLQFYVKDTGIGIKDEHHEKIFQRFIQAETSLSRTYGGTGLGLSISKGLVELLGGKIWVESTPEIGSLFYFTIEHNSSNTVVESNKIKYVAKKTNTILIAEDEEINYLLIKELIAPSGINLIRVKNGQEAVDLCLNDKSIDLILMDIKMPEMDGYTATKIIRVC
ncbi:MAG: PAS domain S-box protein [Bacteroidales bacterium]|nr:PAS domain S-box protein [Bacteroidales bacterium]